MKKLKRTGKSIIHAILSVFTKIKAFNTASDLKVNNSKHSASKSNFERYKLIQHSVVWSDPIPSKLASSKQSEACNHNLPSSIKSFIVHCKQRCNNATADIALLAMLSRLSKILENTKIIPDHREPSITYELPINILVIDQTNSYKTSHVHFCADLLFQYSFSNEQKKKMVQSKKLTSIAQRKLTFFNDSNRLKEYLSLCREGASPKSVFCSNLSIIDDQGFNSLLRHFDTKNRETLCPLDFEAFDIVSITSGEQVFHSDKSFELDQATLLSEVFKKIVELQLNHAIKKITFSDGARKKWQAWTRNEAMNANEVELVAKLAAIFHIVTIFENLDAIKDSSFNSSVDESSIDLAIGWVAQSNFARETLSQYLSDQYLSQSTNSLERKLPDLNNPFSKRELQRKGWRHLKNNNQCSHAIEELIARNYIKKISITSSNGRKVDKIFINPVFLKD